MTSRTSASIAPQKRARSGFSLIESMVVVSIVGLMAAAVLPSMTEMIANNRQQGAAVDIMLLARKARSLAIFGGKYAYGIMFRENAGGGNGAVQIITGLTAFCNRGTGIPINSLFDVITPPVGWQTTAGSVSLRAESLGGHTLRAQMEMPEGTNQSEMRICYTPGGETWAFGGGLPGGGGEQAQAAVISIRRSYAGRNIGVARQVVFMPGGTARMR